MNTKVKNELAGHNSCVLASFSKASGVTIKSGLLLRWFSVYEMWLPLTFIIVGAAWYLNTQRLTTSCRCIPESTCWPSLDDWIVFNKSVNGHVFALRPVAWPCSSQGYDEVQCAEVIRQFHNSSWRAQHAGMAMISFLQRRKGLSQNVWYALLTILGCSGISVDQLGGKCGHT